MHAPNSFKFLVHNAIGGAAERVFEAMSPFDDPYSVMPHEMTHDGSGDQPTGKLLTKLEMTICHANFSNTQKKCSF